jgi:hypothetical protein
MKKQGILMVAACLLAAGARGQDLGVRKFARGLVVLNEGDTLRGALAYYLDQDLLVVQPAHELPKTLGASAVRQFNTSASLTPVTTTAARTEVVPRPTHSQATPTENVPLLTTIPQGRGPAGPVRTALPDTLRSHQYISLAWPPALARQQRSAYGFFELLELGDKITLVQRMVSREYSVQQSVGYTPPVGIDGESSTQVLARYNKAPHMYREEDSRERRVVKKQRLAQILYLIGADGRMSRVENVRRDVLAQCPGSSAALNTYVRTNKLSWHKTDDVVAIVKYANTLR